MVAGMSIQVWLWCEINASVWPRTSLGPVKNLKNWKGRTDRPPFPNRWFICHPLFHIPTRCSLIQLFIMHLKLSPCPSIGPVNLSIRFPCHRLILFNAEAVFFCDDCIVFHITPKRRLFVNKPCAILWSATNISKTKCIPVAAFCTTNPVLNTLNRTLKNILKHINLPFLSSTPEF